MTKEEVEKYAEQINRVFYKVSYGNVAFSGNFDATDPKDKDQNKWNFITLHQPENKRDKILLDGNLIKSIDQI